MSAIGLWWCRQWHRRITTPLHGKYICLHCLREHPVSYK